MVTRTELLNRILRAANELQQICKEAREANILEDFRYSLERQADAIRSELLKQEGVSIIIKSP